MFIARHFKFLVEIVKVNFFYLYIFTNYYYLNTGILLIFVFITGHIMETSSLVLIEFVLHLSPYFKILICLGYWHNFRV